MNINSNYGNLAQSYLFSTIAHKVAAFTPTRTPVSCAWASATSPSPCARPW